jgi:hypothetical protein
MLLDRRQFLSTAAAGALLGACGDPSLTIARPTVGAALRRPTFRPPRGSVLLIAGQNALGLGATPGEDGYLDHVSVVPAGFTFYVGLPDPPPPAANPAIPGLEDGVGLYTALPLLDRSVLHLSVPWVKDGASAIAGGVDRATQEAEQQAVLSGAQDPAIDHLASWCAAQRRPILLRLGYEFDRIDYYDPALYIPAFRHIVSRMRMNDALDNVAFVFSSTNLFGTTDFDAYYPGDAYVDWLGFSMWTPTHPDEVMMAEARKRDKPVLLAETTPVSYDIGQGLVTPILSTKGTSVTVDQIWSGWHAPMIAFIVENSDVIAGWHYISEDWRTDPQWGTNILFMDTDSRPYASPAFLARWTAAIQEAPFLNASPDLFAMLGG